MPTPSFPNIGDNPSTDDIVNILHRLKRDYEWLLQNLDDMNVKRLRADVIVAGVLDAGKVTVRSELTSGYIEIDGNGMRVSNGMFPTFSVDNYGQVTMTRALIRSTPFGYPSIELDPMMNRIGVWKSQGYGVYMTPGDGQSNNASLVFSVGELDSVYHYINNLNDEYVIENINGIRIEAHSGPIRIGSSLNITGVHFQSFYSIIGLNDGRSLGTVLDSKANASNYSGVVIVDGKIFDITNGVIQNVIGA